jgi:hypothetical protein
MRLSEPSCERTRGVVCDRCYIGGYLQNRLILQDLGIKAYKIFVCREVEQTLNVFKEPFPRTERHIAVKFPSIQCICNLFGFDKNSSELSAVARREAPCKCLTS